MVIRLTYVFLLLLTTLPATYAQSVNIDTRSLSENREPTAENPFWADFPIKFVKYAQYSPHLIDKSDSKWLPLATAPILGQAPGLSVSVSRADKQWGQYMRVTLRYRGNQLLRDINLDSWRQIAAISVEDEYRDSDEKGRDSQVMQLRLYPREIGIHQLPSLQLGTANSQILTLTSTPPVVERSQLILNWEVSKTKAWQREAILVQVQLVTSDYSAHIKLDNIKQQQYISKTLHTETIKLPDGRYQHQSGWVIHSIEAGLQTLALPVIRYQLSGSDRRRFHLPLLDLNIQALPTYLPPILPIGKLDIDSQIIKSDSNKPVWNIQINTSGLIPYGVPGLDSQLSDINKQDIANIKLYSKQYMDNDKHDNQYNYETPLPEWLMPIGQDIQIRLRYFNPDSGRLEEITHSLSRAWTMPAWAWVLLTIILIAIVSIAGLKTYPYLMTLIDRIKLRNDIKHAKTAYELRRLILTSNNCITLSQWAGDQSIKLRIIKELNSYCFSKVNHNKIKKLKYEIVPVI